VKLLDYLDFLDFVPFELLDGPGSRRGQLFLWLAGGLVLAGANGWLAGTAPTPLQAPGWGMGAILGAMLLSPPGIIFSGMTISRQPEHSGLAWMTLLAHAAAIGLAIVALI
jgi:hypothetical protein